MLHTPVDDNIHTYLYFASCRCSTYFRHYCRGITEHYYPCGYAIIMGALHIDHYLSSITSNYVVPLITKNRCMWCSGRYVQRHWFSRPTDCTIRFSIKNWSRSFGFIKVVIHCCNRHVPGWWHHNRTDFCLLIICSMPLIAPHFCHYLRRSFDV